MDFIKKVENLSLEGNIAKNWQKFKSNYDIFEVAAGVSTKGEKVEKATFLKAVGQEAF